MTNPARILIPGTDSADFIHGTSKDDDVDGGAGNDCIWGGSGADVISGSIGNDKIWGGSGNDDLAGGLGRDTLFGGSGNDWICGDGDIYWSITNGVVKNIEKGKYSDKIFAGEGNDTILQDLGNDWIECGSGNDSMINFAFGAGTEIFYIFPGSDTVFGGSGDDFIIGHVAHGEAGNDSVYQERGRGDKSVSIITGGKGDDYISVHWNVIAKGGSGNDEIRISNWGEYDISKGYKKAEWIEHKTGKCNIQGGSGDDYIVREATGNNRIHGGAGSDQFASTLESRPKHGDDFVFKKGDAIGVDYVLDFFTGLDDIDFRFYDSNGDGLSDLKKSDVVIERDGAATNILFFGEKIVVFSDGELTWKDFLFV